MNNFFWYDVAILLVNGTIRSLRLEVLLSLDKTMDLTTETAFMLTAKNLCTIVLSHYLVMWIFILLILFLDIVSKIVSLTGISASCMGASPPVPPSPSQPSPFAFVHPSIGRSVADQTPNMTKVRVRSSDSHPTLCVVQWRGKPVFSEPNSTYFIMEKPHMGLDDCLNMLLSLTSYCVFVGDGREHL